MKKNRRHRKALALIAVLWIVVILAVIVTAGLKTSRLDSYTSAYRADRTGAYWLARAAVNTAIGVLDEDLESGQGLGQFEMFEPLLRQVDAGRGIYSVYIVDEASKLNVNTATVEQLMMLADMTEEIARSIVAWREDESSAQAGAEAGYYRMLQVPYEMRHGPYQTNRELLLIHGISDELFYGTQAQGPDLNHSDILAAAEATEQSYDTNRGWYHYLSCFSAGRNLDAEGQGKLNINSADQNELARELGIEQQQAQWIVDNRDHESIGSIVAVQSSDERIGPELFAQIADRITTSDQSSIEGQVNVNTACQTVLAAVLGGNDALDLAESIVNYRLGIGAFDNLGRLLEVEGMSPERFSQVAEVLTVRSDVFSIYACVDFRPGQPGRKWLTEAVISRASEPGTILYSHHGATNWTINSTQQ